jgi:hypothetical protein
VSQAIETFTVGFWWQPNENTNHLTHSSPTTHRLIHRRFERCILVPRTCVHPILSILFIHNNTEEKCLETRAAPLRRAQGAAAAPDGPWN